jgi:hypothetical protein
MRNVEFAIDWTFPSSWSLAPPNILKWAHSTLLPPFHMSLSSSTPFPFTLLLHENHDAREIQDASRRRSWQRDEEVARLTGCCSTVLRGITGRCGGPRRARLGQISASAASAIPPGSHHGSCVPNNSSRLNPGGCGGDSLFRGLHEAPL